MRATILGSNEPASADSAAATKAAGSTTPANRTIACNGAQTLPCSICPAAQNSNKAAEGDVITARAPATRATVSSIGLTGAEASTSEMPSRSGSAARSVKAAA